MKFLCFDDETHALSVFSQWLMPDGTFPSMIGSVSVDVLGYVLEDTVTEQGVEPITKFHVNITDTIDELEPYATEHPTQPYRVFAGWPPEVIPEEVPSEIPRWVGVLALKLNKLEGSETTLWDAVSAYRNGIADPVTKAYMDAALHDANSWVRDSPTVHNMALILNLTEERIDELFIWAKNIQL